MAISSISIPIARSGRFPRSYPVFFLLACLYSAVTIPIWSLEWIGQISGCDGCDAAAHHGHEMLFGYVGAVIAGYLLTRVTRVQLALAVFCWGIARVGTWMEWHGIGGTVAGLAFPIILFLLAGLPFWRAARTARNMVFAPLIFTLIIAECLVIGGHAHSGVLLAFDLATMLILVMGGRLIPAAMTGLVRRAEGHELLDRNKPWLEWVSVTGLLMAAVGHAFALPQTIGYVGYLTAAIAAWLRQTRWRPGLAIKDSSLGPLQLGYFILAVGLAATATAAWVGHWPARDAFHLATIGGVGIVTTTMMLRTVNSRERLAPANPHLTWLVALLLVAAAGLRTTASIAPSPLLLASALLWALAQLLTMAIIMAQLFHRPRSVML